MRDQKVRRDVILRQQQKTQRGGQPRRVMEDCSRRVATTGKALSLTMDRRVCQTARDVDVAKHSHSLASVSAGGRSLSHRYVGARPC